VAEQNMINPGRTLRAIVRLGRRIALNPTTVIAAIIFLLIGIGVIIYGFAFIHEIHDWKTFVTEIYPNLGVEFISISLTVLVIDTLNQKRTTRERKDELILQMGSPDNATAGEAVRILRHKGWLTDKSLRGAQLANANLEGAFLWKANLDRANLLKSNLKHADLRHANLQKAELHGANLQNASLGGAQLNGAILVGANLEDARLWGSNLEGADLRSANVQNAVWEDTAFGCAILPDGTEWTEERDLRQFTHPEEWKAEQAVKAGYA
jgi:hypothetical protein